MHSNVMLRFMVFALQDPPDPPLCSSTNLYTVKEPGKWFQGIDSKESIPVLLKRLQIRAQALPLCQQAT